MEWAYAALGAVLGLVVIYRIFLRDDTSPSSMFFTIDISALLYVIDFRADFFMA